MPRLRQRHEIIEESSVFHDPRASSVGGAQPHAGMRSRGLRVSRDEIVVVTDTAVVDLEDLRRLVPLLYPYLRHADACAGTPCACGLETRRYSRPPLA